MRKGVKSFIDKASSEQKQEIQGLIKKLKIKLKGGGSRKKNPPADEIKPLDEDVNPSPV